MRQFVYFPHTTTTLYHYYHSNHIPLGEFDRRVRVMMYKFYRFFIRAQVNDRSGPANCFAASATTISPA